MHLNIIFRIVYTQSKEQGTIFIRLCSRLKVFCFQVIFFTVQKAYAVPQYPFKLFGAKNLWKLRK